MTIATSTMGRPGIRRTAALLAILGMAVRALIPLGYMPGNIAAGEFVVLCPVGLPAGMKSHGHHGHDGAVLDADRACPIGSALQYAALPAGELVQAIPAVFEASSPVAVENTYNEVLRRGYSPRGPPQERHQPG